ncbi:MAG TPA: TonB-dependent receptor [Kofleriaceae bacterium]|nr:TonB-dependent receptor [Kofleriaceae bacterium]
MAARRAWAADGDEDRPSFTSTVQAPKPVGFVTVVDAKVPNARVVSVADLIEHQAGVFVRSRGGLGAFTSVSIRGSEANEVAILVDGVPLTRAASGVIDLSQLPASGLDRVEIYRGVPPVEFGSEAIGGAINLVTRRGSARPTWRAAAGLGSFGARSASAGHGRSSGALKLDVSAAYHGATGDFPYYDTAGTLANTTDDRITYRKNNGFDQGAVDVTVAGGTTDRARWHLGAHGFVRHQGVPGVGIAGAETDRARLTTGRLLADGGATGTRGRLTWRAAASLLYERNSFSNPAGERVGPFGANVTEGEALAGGLTGRLAVPWAHPAQPGAQSAAKQSTVHQLWSFLAELRAEHRRPYNLLFPAQAGAPSTRVLGAVAVVDEVRLWGGRATLTPAVRLDAVHSRLAPGGDAQPRQSDDVFVSPRLTVRLEVAPAVTLRAGGGRFVRFPTLLELFGDGAFVLPRPTLVPESAWGGDAGLAVTTRGKRGHAALEAAFFGRQVENTIAFVSGGNTASATNLGETRMLGVEARGQAGVGDWLSLRVEYTYLSATRLATGKQLAGRPEHELNLRVELRSAPFRLFYELSYVHTIYRDPENFAFVPERLLHALGAGFERDWMSLLIEVRNLADLRVVELPLTAGRTTPYPLTDYFNYPLPGRAIYATFAVRH